MNMVSVVIDRHKLYQRIVFCNFRQLRLQISKNSRVDYPFPVLRHHYDVIVAMVDAMRKMGEFHLSQYTPPKDAGITSSLDLTVGDFSKVA